MLDHLEKKEYQKAMDIAESIDWRRVKNASMLNTVSEIYEYNGEFKKAVFMVEIFSINALNFSVVSIGFTPSG